MGSLEAASRHRLVVRSRRIGQIPNADQPSIYRDPLPAIGFLGKDGSGYNPRYPPSATASPTPLMSPNVMYTGQHLPYSYAPSASGPPPGYVSSPEARRAIEDEKEKHTPRQSLPSIHEALGNDNPLPYPTPTSAPPSQSTHSAPPSHIIGRPSAEGPSGPPNPFSNPPPTGTMIREPGFAHQAQLQADPSRSSLASINTQDSRNPSLHSISTGKSPTQSSKTANTSVGSQNSSGYEYSAPTSAGSVASPNGYSHFPQNYSFQTQPAGHSYPPAPYDNRPYMGASRVEEVKGGFVGRPAPPHSDSVKRHLDVFDVETSLNEVCTLNFYIVT
ncbi:Zinc fingerNHR/GATA-type [Penicillium sp. IBT 31633x]|nr:Zinc fingerNHR/GATA-type [Penicillium sp. IBT 31633x]